MINIETAIALALQQPAAMDRLGAALQIDLVTANAFYRKIVEFANNYFIMRRKLPSHADYEVWLESLPVGMQQDGTREAIGRLLSVEVDDYDPAYFSDTLIPQFQKAAAQTMRARLNEAKEITPEAIRLMADRIDSIVSTPTLGIARLEDYHIWTQYSREDDVIPTGFRALDKSIGGFGKELWLVFADSGVGKSMLLQNFGTNIASRGKNVLHITLELGMRPQILRYYRQITEMNRAEFSNKKKTTKRRLKHWFKFAHGSIILIQHPAYSLTVDDLKRLIESVNRILEQERKGQVDVVITDYLDLLKVAQRSRSGAYEDLGVLTHNARSICPLFDCTHLSATQSVRKPVKAERLTQADMGDSYNKVRGSDGLLSLVQTPEEEEESQGRLGLVKVRDSGGKGDEIPLYINRELSLIQELDNPNTIRLMRELGQLENKGDALRKKSSRKYYDT